MKMNTIELNIDKYESMLKEIGVLKTENEDLKKRLLTSHNSDYTKCPECGEIYLKNEVQQHTGLCGYCNPPF